MRRSLAAGFTILCGALAACDPGTTGPQCDLLATTVATTKGDTAVTETGLKYIETSPGTGQTAKSCDFVGIEYIGRRASNDSIFAPLDTLGFAPGYHQYLAGFEQGVVGMKVGGSRRLIIPPELAYGSRDQQGLPANSTVIFDIKLLGINPQQ
jgi:FKBP-type peptidyl-prolyl cis-trans isomerase